MEFEDVLRSFDHVKKIKTGKRCKQTFSARCPAHRDKHNSLTISEGEDGKTLLYCHAGCSTESILAAAGLSIKNLCIGRSKLSCIDRLTWFYASEYKWTDEHDEEHRGYGEGVFCAAQYPYYNEDGKYLYTKLRFEGGSIEGKLIRYYFIDHINDKARSLKASEVDRTLYRLPQFLLLKKKARWVYIVEGEKDVETLRELGNGFGCVTTAGGAADWRPEYARYFKGLDVCILQDNDEPGEKLSKMIVRDLRPYAHFVKIVVPSNIPHGDVTDFLNGGGNEKT